MGDFQLSLARSERGFYEAQTGVVDGQSEVEREEGVGAGLGVSGDQEIRRNAVGGATALARRRWMYCQ